MVEDNIYLYNLSMIYACDSKGGIGKDGRLPWPKLDRDMLRFMERTQNSSIVIAGRKTYDSIPNKLAGRKCFVVTRNADYDGLKEGDHCGPLFIEGWDNFDVKIRDVAFIARKLGRTVISDIMVIGGGEIYRMFAPYANKLYVTEIEGDYDCDTFFQYHKDTKEWDYVVDGVNINDKKTGINYCFKEYFRKNG